MALAALVLPSAVLASPFAHTILGTDPELVIVDLETLDTESIGPIGTGGVPLFLGRYRDGPLYAIESVPPAAGFRLATYDLTTGAGTVIGPVEPAIPTVGILGLAVDSSHRLWAIGSIFSGPPQPSYVFEIDPATGATGTPRQLSTTLRGLSGTPAGLLTQSDQGVALLTPDTGALTLLQPQLVLFDWAIDLGPDGRVWGGAHPISTAETDIYVLDLATGEATKTGTLVGARGLAIDFDRSGGPRIIPTLSPGALVVLVGTLALAALWVRRRPAHREVGRRGLILLVLGTLALCPGPARAETGPIAYMTARVDHEVYLARADLSTLELELIGPTTTGYGASWLSLRSDGSLYGVQWPWPIGELRQLVRYDLATGTATVIGPLDHGIPGARVDGLAFDSADRLWGLTSTEGAPFPAPSFLFEIDPATAATSTPTELVFPQERFHTRLLAPWDDGLITQTDAGFATLDPSTAEVAILDPPGVVFTVDMDRAPDGTLWGGMPIPIGMPPTVVIYMNLHTGEGGSTGHLSGVSGLAIDPALSGGPRVIPTLSPGALLLLAGALAFAAIWGRRPRGDR